MSKFADAVLDVYQKRQTRLVDPDGKFDNGGRWYPSESEKCECCGYVRSPSRAWPYSYLLHCRTRKHVANLLAKRESAS